MPNWEGSYVTAASGYTTSQGEERIYEESVEVPTRNIATDRANGVALPKGQEEMDYDMDDGGYGGNGMGGVPMGGPVMEGGMDMEDDMVKASVSRYGTDAQSVGYTAYTMNMTSGEQIVEELRNVGVNVLSVEGDADVFAYLDAVTAERLPGEQCLLYTDDMGRVFNIVIAGGCKGLASAFENIQGTFCGWLACAFLPFLGRILASASIIRTDYPHTASSSGRLLAAMGLADDAYQPNLGVHPLFLLAVFGLILSNETSHTWLSTAIHVRGTNSVGAYVWNSAVSSDYPRAFCLLALAVASFAPVDTGTRDAVTAAGAAIGLVCLAANLGGRAWKKLNLGYMDGDSILGPLWAYCGAVLAGITFPYIGMRSVNGGSDDADVTAGFGPSQGGRRARQVVGLTASFVVIMFALTDAQPVQDALGFNWRHRGTVNLAVGTWWLLSAVASMSVCRRMEPVRSIKIEPFLKRDEVSPVGCVVPSIPNMVVSPGLRGEGYFGCCSIGADIVLALVVAALGGLLVWQGVQQIDGRGGESAWDIIPDS